jgi:hypothetical protein
VEQLKKEPGPAFIMDDLWFVHAYNAASLRLFGVDYKGDDKDKLRWWQSWHVIATKFTPGSIIRDAHIDPNLYFRPAVEQFCGDIRDYLFTVQVRSLIQKIYELSSSGNFGFERMWLPAVTFESDDFPLDGFRRTLKHPHGPDVRLEARTIPAFYRDIEVVAGSRYTTRYKLVVWNGIDRLTEEFFNEIGGPNQDILFAADFDTDEDNRFHVNDWPEVRRHIDLVEETR